MTTLRLVVLILAGAGMAAGFVVSLFIPDPTDYPPGPGRDAAFDGEDEWTVPRLFVGWALAEAGTLFAVWCLLTMWQTVTR